MPYIVRFRRGRIVDNLALVVGFRGLDERSCAGRYGVLRVLELNENRVAQQIEFAQSHVLVGRFGRVATELILNVLYQRNN